MKKLLDSDAVKKALYDAVDDISSGYYVVMGIREEDIEGIIDSVPPAQSERKRGKWEYHMSYGICLNCGYEYNWTGTDAKNFCPHCGEDMR